MTKITAIVVATVAILAASGAFAGGKACCARGASKAGSMACVNLTTLNLTPAQKTKIEAWQSDCMKAGCTKESRVAFLNKARRILSAEQFAQLKAQCEKTANAKKTET